MRISMGVITVLIVCFASTARAQVVTLICEDSMGKNSTYDLDLVNQTIFYVSGNPPRKVRAEITNRIVTWDSPYWEHSLGLDRTTGQLSIYHTVAGWRDLGSCKRASGDILRD